MSSTIETASTRTNTNSGMFSEAGHDTYNFDPTAPDFLSAGDDVAGESRGGQGGNSLTPNTPIAHDGSLPQRADDEIEADLPTMRQLTDAGGMATGVLGVGVGGVEAALGGVAVVGGALATPAGGAGLPVMAGGAALAGEGVVTGGAGYSLYRASLDDLRAAPPLGSPPPITPPASTADGPGDTVVQMATPPTAAAALPAVASAAVATARTNGCKLIFVPEVSGTMPSQLKGQAYQAEGPNGGLVDKRNQSPIVPALEYTNPNPTGAPYVKFDNFEPLPGGLTAMIDSKTAIVASPSSSGDFWTAPNTKNGLQRENAALIQNPGCKGFLQVPDAYQASLANAVLTNLNIENITVQIRPWK